MIKSNNEMQILYEICVTNGTKVVSWGIRSSDVSTLELFR